MRGLTALHGESKRGVSDVSFTVPRGSFTIITGQVGSGKSTLLRAILGLLPAQAGEVCWDGEAVVDRASFFRPPRSAYTPQTPRLFSDTLAENISQGVAIDRAELDAAVYQAVMEPDVAQLEKGLDTLVGPRGVRLSGGQIQRSAAARMFVRRPALLVFDDLSSALDVETERLLWERLASRTAPAAEPLERHRACGLPSPGCLATGGPRDRLERRARRGTGRPGRSARLQRGDAAALADRSRRGGLARRRRFLDFNVLQCGRSVLSYYQRRSG